MILETIGNGAKEDKTTKAQMKVNSWRFEILMYCGMVISWLARGEKIDWR